MSGKTVRRSTLAVVALAVLLLALGLWDWWASPPAAQHPSTPEFEADSSSSWTEGAALPEPRWFHESVLGGDGRIYTLGGWVSLPGKPREPAWPERKSAILDRRSGRWERAEVPSFKFHLTDRGRWLEERGERPEFEMPIATADSRGRVFWFSDSGPVYFDPATGTWGQPEKPVWDQKLIGFVPEASVPHFRHVNGAAAGGPDGRIYLVGGAGYSLRRDKIRVRELELLNVVEIYDPERNSYTLAAPMRQARQIFEAVFGPDGRLYVFGGYGTVPSIGQREGESNEAFAARGAEMDRFSIQALASVEAYDPATNTWMERAPMPKPRQSAGAALCPDGRIYLVGGKPSWDSKGGTPDLQIYDPQQDRWVEGPPLRTRRQGHSVVCTSDGMLYAIGGTNSARYAFGEREFGSGGPLASVEVLDTSALGARAGGP